jgi:GT2 family glycosyltransferase
MTPSAKRLDRNLARTPESAACGLASVIIACYNDADIVERNVAAFARQTVPDFELILADDGSQEDYGPMLERWSGRFTHPIQHVLHEDIGFRKTRILNRAILVSRFERLIFVDMDCLPHRDFVRNHLRYLEPRTALAGRAAHLRREDIPSANDIWRHGLRLNSLRLIVLWLRGRAWLVEHGILLPIGYEIPYRGIVGCNFSAWKADLERINGFNAEFTGPGWEDTDVDYRLRLAGVRIRTVRHRIIEYHVDHPARVNNDQLNRARLEAAHTATVARAPVGLAEIQDGDFQHRIYSPKDLS